MSIAVDSNILIAFWNDDDELNVEAERSLRWASGSSNLVIAAPVYVELRALPQRTQQFIDGFLWEMGIEVDWAMDERVWREAARAAQEYGRRRQSDRQARPPRRIAGDFAIGAHAMVRGHDLLTLDQRTFRIAFPGLRIVSESRQPR